MTERLSGIPFMILISILLSGLFIFVFFQFVDKYHIAFTKRKKVYSDLHSFLPGFKLFIWFVWFVISLYWSLISSPVITITFLVGFYLFSRDFWNNIYSGIILLIKTKVKKGDYISLPILNLEGLVTDMMLVDLELKSDNEDLIYVPYGLIMKSPIIKKEKSGNHFLNEFYILEKGDEQGLTEKRIKAILLRSPWTVLSKPIEIDMNTSRGIYIHVYTFNKETGIYQQNILKRELGNITIEK